MSAPLLFAGIASPLSIVSDGFILLQTRFSKPLFSSSYAQAHASEESSPRCEAVPTLFCVFLLPSSSFGIVCVLLLQVLPPLK